MKLLLLTLIAATFFLSAKAQQPDTTKTAVSDTTVYDVTEKMPEFPGGLPLFYSYIAKNIRYPKDAVMNGIKGKVIVRMIIEKNGSISNVTVLRNVYPSLDEEAMRIIRDSPKWNPGMQNGKPIRALWAIPISFATGK